MQERLLGCTLETQALNQSWLLNKLLVLAFLLWSLPGTPQQILSMLAHAQGPYLVRESLSDLPIRLGGTKA